MQVQFEACSPASPTATSNRGCIHPSRGRWTPRPSRTLRGSRPAAVRRSSSWLPGDTIDPSPRSRELAGDNDWAAVDDAAVPRR
jgi:hypothetical protein